MIAFVSLDWRWFSSNGFSLAKWQASQLPPLHWKRRYAHDELFWLYRRHFTSPLPRARRGAMAASALCAFIGIVVESSCIFIHILCFLFISICFISRFSFIIVARDCDIIWGFSRSKFWVRHRRFDRVPMPPAARCFRYLFWAFLYRFQYIKFQAASGYFAIF